MDSHQKTTDCTKHYVW